MTSSMIRESMKISPHIKSNSFSPLQSDEMNKATLTTIQLKLQLNRIKSEGTLKNYNDFHNNQIVNHLSPLSKRSSIPPLQSDEINIGILVFLNELLVDSFRLNQIGTCIFFHYLIQAEGIN